MYSCILTWHGQALYKSRWLFISCGEFLAHHRWQVRIETFFRFTNIIINLSLTDFLFLIFFVFILGLAVMVLMIPLNGVAAQRMKVYQQAQMRKKDQRSRLMDEILNGMKILKLYAWENSFNSSVTDIRKQEMSALLKSAYLNAFT